MAVLYILTVIFVITPAISALIMRDLERNELILTNNGYRAAEELKGLEVLISATIWISIYILLTALGYGKITGHIHRLFAIIPFTILPIASVLLSLIALKPLWADKRFTVAITLTLTYGGLWISWWAGSIAAGHVSEITDLNATEMPSAVAGLTLTYAPILWGLAASVAFLAMYLLAGLSMVVIPILKKEEIKNETSAQKWRRFFILTSRFVGLACASVISLELLDAIPKSQQFKKFESFILNYSGYPLEKHRCAPGSAKNDKFAMLSSGDVAVAKYISEIETKYFTISCAKVVTQWMEPAEQVGKAEGQK